MNTFKSILILLIAINLNLNAQSTDPKANQINLEYKSEAGINQLRWESNREVNTSYYIVERSIDGNNFETVGQLKAGSSTYSKKHYHFDDLADSSEPVSYRLKLIFMDGRSKTIEPNFIELENKDKLTDLKD